MELEYKLTYTDFLEHQLYNASISASVKRKRLTGRLIIPVLYIAIGIYFITILYNPSISALFSVFGFSGLSFILSIQG